MYFTYVKKGLIRCMFKRNITDNIFYFETIMLPRATFIYSFLVLFMCI